MREKTAGPNRRPAVPGTGGLPGSAGSAPGGGAGGGGGLVVIVVVGLVEGLVEPAVGHPEVERTGGALQLARGPAGQRAVEPGEGAGGGHQRDRGLGDPLLDVLALEDRLAVRDQGPL